MKAYDTVIWNFFWSVTKALKYPDGFIALIKACVSNDWFSVIVNGSIQGHVKSTRGLRQGDPLSSYLLIVVMDYFTELLQPQEDFEFHPQCKEIGLTNLNFADHLFVLSAATEKSMKLIMKEFGEISGLHPNLAKSLDCIVIKSRVPVIFQGLGIKKQLG
ncbi:hypothetical protein LIER_33529 [Lithospermum erythrorhizon]|uniref:Reverse transcriptase domain-containing protein n=1 Tax=Lithospermum erythrorhizon TaxID=34254 RepID=A0AAV3S264_LITER